jgi:hypothetical protein
MSESHLNFEQRLRRLERKHAALAGGFVTQVQSDGLVVIRPKRLRASFPLRPVLLFIAAFFLFKGFLLAQLGEVTYDDRVAKLRDGTAVEQVGALLMQKDPVAEFTASYMVKILY